MFSKFTKPKDGTVAVDLIALNPRLGQLVHEALARDPRFALQASFKTVTEAGDRGLTGHTPAILLAEIDIDRPGELAALDGLMHGQAHGRPVIVFIGSLTEGAVRLLLQLQVSDLLTLDASPDDLLRACERASRPNGASGGLHGAGCYAFVSAGGGAGNTSLAIQSAFVIARKTRQFQSTCLIDMDFQGGAVADYLDVAANLQLDEVAPSPDRLDAHLLEVMLSRHGTGLAVLAAHHALRPYDAVSGGWVTRLLDMASLKFDSLVLDMPRVWLPWSKMVLRGSDRVFIVTEMTVPGLRQARRLLGAIGEQCGDETDVTVIVNRFRQSLLGGGNAVRRKDAELLFGDCLAGFVSEDYRLVREAIDRGVPLDEISKGNWICRDLEAILFAEREQRLPVCVPEAAPARAAEQ